VSRPVKIPADLDHPDRVLAGLTARQTVILGCTVLLVYAGWLATRALLPLGVFAVLAVPVVVAGIALAIFRHRDGISLDRYAAAALLYRLRPRLLAGQPAPAGEAVPSWVAARAHPVTLPADPPPLPPGGRTGRLDLPAHPLTHTPTDAEAGAGDAVGVLDLGGHGMAVIAAATPVPFALRGEEDQEALVGCFARMLHAADGPLQILIRALRLDLSAALGELAEAAGGLADPALRAAAADHYQHLAALDTEGLLTRQILLVLREPTPAGATATAAAAPARLVARLRDAARALAPAGIHLTPLDPTTAETVLATALDPDQPPPTPTFTAGVAGAGPVLPTWPTEQDGWGR
jgi:PrgI family protein